MSEDKYPSWRYGPDGEARVFNSADDVPKGWHDHPSKAKRHEDGGGEPGDRRASRVELMAELRARGIQYAESDGGAQLAALLAKSGPVKVDSNGRAQVFEGPEPEKGPGPPAEPIPVPFNPPPPLEFAQPPAEPFVAPEPVVSNELDEINALRAAYKKKFGKKPGPAWDEATLREKLAE